MAHREYQRVLGGMLAYEVKVFRFRVGKPHRITRQILQQIMPLKVPLKNTESEVAPGIPDRG